MPPSSSRRPPVSFRTRMAILGFQHAVAQCGFYLLCLVLETLIEGDINDAIGCVKAVLETNTQYKNSFTKPEQECLENLSYQDWDISLLFKVIQKICGLQLVNHPCWTKPSRELEYLITTIKNWRNELVHKMNLVYTKEVMMVRMNELSELSGNMIAVLGERAQTRGKQMSLNESDEVLKTVSDIIEDVKRTINEIEKETVPHSHTTLSNPAGAVPEGVDDSDEEDDYESDGIQYDSAVGSDYEGRSMDEIQLEQAFWKYVGDKHTMV